MGYFTGMEHLDVRKGAWTEEEDILLRKCIEKYGEGKWRQVPMKAGRVQLLCKLGSLQCSLIAKGSGRNTCVYSAVMRNHLSEVRIMVNFFGRLPGRTANDVKNYWNSHLSRRLSMKKGVQSHMKSMNATTTTTTTTTKIIRPQPRTFSPNSKWLNGIGSSILEAQLKQMSNNATMPGSPQEESALWWKSLLAEEEKEDTWWSKAVEVGKEEALPLSFEMEEMERMRKEGDGLMMEGGGLGERDNMLLDIDLWGFLET
ncbi:transcription factor MYB114 isoform X2 [Cinnamomum micranthum f. kanehirae]|uniref:Transcription factor MYB114 isoform X2 n=1 Tax=Cinnamomum micranthum f. kanehirae TaxID=337451 RepID=A0A3S3M0U4_9MAGN|nr:transcription factor MYB114 isoform X2 [Cinnamomum micranthum f. kanehirae]